MGKEEHKQHENADEIDDGEWRPSMNLFNLIKSIPEFIAKILNEVNDKKNKNNAPRMIGKFYLGLNYDYQQIWMQN